MDDRNFGVIDDYELMMDFDIDFDFWMSECCFNHAAEENTNTQFDLNIPYDPQPGKAANDALQVRGFDDEPQLDKNGGGWVRRRKRLKKGTIEYIQRKQEIRVQNRISARKSIQKKKTYIRELERKFKMLEAENRFRKRVLQIFPNAKPAGRLCGLRRVFSTSDFYLPREAATEKHLTDFHQ